MLPRTPLAVDSTRDSRKTTALTSSQQPLRLKPREDKARPTDFLAMPGNQRQRLPVNLRQPLPERFEANVSETEYRSDRWSVRTVWRQTSSVHRVNWKRVVVHFQVKKPRQPQ